MKNDNNPEGSATVRSKDFESDALAVLVEQLAAEDSAVDQAGVWSEATWSRLRGAGANHWGFPGRSTRAQIVHRYARIAQGSLTAAFILTQHDAAVRRLAAASSTVASSWLERIETGQAFATVGISHLTTSRRLGPAAMRASVEPGGFRLDGSMPWVTAAERADLFVTGAVLEDGRQILLALPADRPGVEVRPAFMLSALEASRTAEVACHGVRVREDDILYGPAADVMSIPGLTGTGGLETSALALGQAYAALAALRAERGEREDLAEPVEALERSWSELWDHLIGSAASDPSAPNPAAIRSAANAFVLRCTQSFLTVRKGSGFVRGESAERWARQALFFLVWSCPSPVAHAALRDFAGICPG